MSRELIDEYEAGGARLSLAIRGLVPQDLQCPTAPGKWSIQQVAVHLADAELVLADRMKRVIAEDRPPLLAFDESRWMTALLPPDRSAEDAGALVEMVRRDVTKILRSLPPEAFRRTGVHSEAGELTLETIVRKANDHLEHHLKFIHGKRATMGKEMW